MVSGDGVVSTGVISNIVLQGVTADFSSIIAASQTQNFFAGAPYLSVFAGGSTGGQYGYLDNLVVSNNVSVPEPTSLAVLGAAALGLIRRRRRSANLGPNPSIA